MEKLHSLLEVLQTASDEVHRYVHTKYGYESNLFNMIHKIDDEIDDMMIVIREEIEAVDQVKQFDTLIGDSRFENGKLNDV